MVFCLDRAGVTGDDGPSHHGVLDMMLLTKVPGMTVFAPSSYEEVGNMLHEALGMRNGPVAIRWPKSEARSVPSVGSGLRARKISSGSSVCLVGVGKLVAACEQAAELLAAKGVDATVWDARLASPLDPDMVEDALAHDLVVSVEDGIVDGGVGWRIAESIARGGARRRRAAGGQPRRADRIPGPRRRGRHPLSPWPRRPRDQPGGTRAPCLAPAGDRLEDENSLQLT